MDCKNCKSHRSKTIGLIHVISAQDYIKICQTLITPSEVHEYLQFREALIERYQNQVFHISEPALLGQFLYGDLKKEPNENYLKCLHSVKQNHHLWNMSKFLEDFPQKIIGNVQPKDYYPIVSEIAKLNRNDLIEFRKRFSLTVKNAKSNEVIPPYRMVIPRTSCGFVFVPCPKQFRENQIQALKNFTYAHKYDQKLHKCLGVSVAQDNDDYFLIFWGYLESPWEYNEEMDLKLKKSFPFREINAAESPRYSFKEVL